MLSDSVFQTPDDQTYTAWIFDTGAYFQITADFSHLLEPIRRHIGLRGGGGASLNATHIVSVQLHMEIVGSVLPVTLSDG